jgi:hypothetical protein
LSPRRLDSGSDDGLALDLSAGLEPALVRVLIAASLPKLFPVRGIHNIGNLTVTTVPSPNLLSTLILPPMQIEAALHDHQTENRTRTITDVIPAVEGVEEPFSIGFGNSDPWVANRAYANYRVSPQSRRRIQKRRTMGSTEELRR